MLDIPARARAAGVYYGWVLVATLGVTQTVGWGILYYGFSTFMPAIEADRGWTRGEMSGAFSVALLMSSLMAGPVGLWLDRHGPRALMSAGSLAAAILLVGLSQASTLLQFYLVWALMGAIMATVLYEPAFAVVTAWFTKDRTRALAAVTFMAGLASTIFMPFQGWLIQSLGWRSALLALAGMIVLLTAIPHAALLRRRSYEPATRLVDDAPATPSQGAPDVRGASLGQALRDPAFQWLAIAFALNKFSSVAVHTHLLLFLHDRGHELTIAATLAGLIGAFQVTGRIVLTALGDRCSLPLLTTLILALQPLALVILLMVPGLAGLLAFVTLFGISVGIATLLRPAFVAEQFGRGHYGAIAGTLASVTGITTALAPVSAGIGYDLLGSYEPLLWCFVGLSCIAVVAVRKADGGRPTSASLLRPRATFSPRCTARRCSDR